MKLSASDWITIAGITIQVTVAIGIAIWQIRATSHKTSTPKEMKPEALQTSNAIWFVKNSWTLWFGLAVSSFAMWETLSTAAPLTGDSVFLVVLLSWWFMFNLMCIAIYGIATFIREPYGKLRQIIDRIK